MNAPAQRADPPLVLDLSPPADAPTSAPRPQARRRSWLRRSFLLAVVLPVLAGALYFGTLASDRYVAGAGFAVRGLDPAGGSDVIGAVTGLASTGSTTSDSYIVLRFLESRDLVQRLDAALDLHALYRRPGSDPLSRLPEGARAEDLVDYWTGRIRTAFDATSGIVTFEVEAFSPEDAHRLAALVLEEARGLVNALSQSARADTLRFAEEEVARAEERLRAALEAVRAFRDKERAIDPAAAALARVELLAGLETQLLDLRARIAAFGDSVAADAPALTSLRRRAGILEAQIAETRASGGGAGALPDGTTLSGQLAAYESLEIEKGFAERAYASALSSLEQARADADRAQRYLAVYAHPLRPEEPRYPERLIAVLVLAAAATAAWGIGALVVYAVRDHLA